MNRPVFFATLLASILALAAPTLAAGKVNPASLVQQAATAQNRGDVAGVLALYSDDAVLQVGALCSPTPCVGKAAIQKEIERRVADKARATIIGKYVSGNVAAVQFEIRGDSVQKAGVDRFIVWNIYEVKGDKIVAGTAAPQRTDPQTAHFFECLRSWQEPARCPLWRARSSQWRSTPTRSGRTSCAQLMTRRGAQRAAPPLMLIVRPSS